MAERLDYVNYDFDDNVQQLIDRVQSQDAWTDTYRSSTGQMLIELYAFVANQVLFYVERRAEEGYISTARNRSSIVNLVRLLNYIPKRRVSATGVLVFTIPTPSTKNIFIPKYTECQTAARVKYLVAEDVVMLAGQTTVNASAIQGELVTSTSIATGQANQEYHIEDTEVEENNLFVNVEDVLWTEESSLLTARPQDQVYLIEYELDDTVTIKFGDGQKGKNPPSSLEMKIQYIRSAGVDGNVYGVDSINVINTTIYDSDGAVVQDIEVTNTDTFLGGDEREDTEEIRTEAPKVFATGDRAVTKYDYIAILENYAGIANANVWGENEESPPNYTMFNRVKIVILLQEWQHPGVQFKADLGLFLKTKAQVTVKYEYVQAVILQVIPRVDIKASMLYALTNVQDSVEAVLAEQFVLGTTTRLGVAKRISDVTEKVDNAEGVSYVHLVMEIRKVLDAAYDSFYAYGQTLDAIEVLPSSVRVFIDDEQFGIDDGVNGFISVGSGYVVTGAINYTTGAVGVDITPAPAGVVSVRYQQAADGDVEVTSNQICQLYEVDVVAISYDNS